MATVTFMESIESLFSPEQPVKPDVNGIFTSTISRYTLPMWANGYYFGHPEWGQSYFQACHRDAAFRSRWHVLIHDWQDKVVVDIGCAGGNVAASLQAEHGLPKVLIGVDVSYGALEIAQTIGYIPVLADAQNLPFVSAFADIVILNATLHHCEDMAQALREAARLVKPGGKLLIDHDPQQSAWKNSPLARSIWQLRLPLYRLLRRGGHATAEEQYWGIATEVHHRPGDGVTAALFEETLTPLGFTLQLYPHNNSGVEAFVGEMGLAPLKVRCVQQLTGIRPNTPEAATILMCVATRSLAGG